VLFCPHPQPLSHKVGEGGRVVLPSPPAPLLRSAPTLWSAEALASASGGNFASALHIPLACVREGACCFALTPSPSPTLWERGVGARHAAPSASGGSFASALHIPLARLWERGARGVRAKRKMRPEESRRRLLTSRKWGVWNSTPQPQYAGLSSSGGGAAPADPPDPNPAQSCSQAQEHR